MDRRLDAPVERRAFVFLVVGLRAPGLLLVAIFSLSVLEAGRLDLSERMFVNRRGAVVTFPCRAVEISELRGLRGMCADYAVCA